MAKGSRKRKAAGRKAPSQPRGKRPAPPARPRQPRPPPQHQPPSCRVEGCREALKPGYQKKYRICVTHGSAHDLVIDGRTVRWCQQCGRFHPLQVFWGTQRSCRDSLLRHQERRLRRQGQTTAAAAQFQMQMQPAPPPAAGRLLAPPAAPPAPRQPQAQPPRLPTGQLLSAGCGPGLAAALSSLRQAAAAARPVALSSPRRAAAVAAPAAVAPPPPPPRQQQQQQERRQERRALEVHAAPPQTPARPAKRAKQQQADPEQPVERSGQQTSPLRPASSSSCRSACAAASLPATRPAHQPLPQASPSQAALLAVQAAAFAAQQAEQWDPVAPVTPAGRPDRPNSTARPLPAAIPMHPTAGQALPQDVPWPVVRLAAPGLAAADLLGQLALQYNWPQPSSSSHQPWQPVPQHQAAQSQPSRPAAWPGAVSVQQLPQGQTYWPQPHQAEQQQREQPQPLGHTFWPAQPWEPQHAQHWEAQHAELMPQRSQAPPQHCGSSGDGGASGRGSGRSRSPRLPCFDADEIQALVEVLNPPSLDPPTPDLLEEALACAGGAVPYFAAGPGPAAGAGPCCVAIPRTCTWGVPCGQPLCSGAACDSPIVHLPVPQAPTPPLFASPAEGCGGSAAAWQQLWEAATREGEQRAARAFGAPQPPQHSGAVPPAPQPAPSAAPPSAPLCCPPVSSGQAHSLLQAPACDWHEDLLTASPLHCPPSPTYSWMC